jgi:hypothetical protein
MYYIIPIISIILLLIIFKLYYQENYDNNVNELNYEIKNDNPNIIIDNIQKCQSSVKPGNYFYSNDNISNFNSNILNLNKFYKIKYNNDIIDFQSKTRDISLDKIKDQKCFPSRKEAIKSEPDNWQYKNDFIMNGAKIFNNVVGFDRLNIPFNRSINNDDINQNVYSKSINNVEIKRNTCTNQISCNVEPDDIREGLGYPGRYYRENN